jgi:hypothetical protein
MSDDGHSSFTISGIEIFRTEEAVLHWKNSFSVNNRRIILISMSSLKTLESLRRTLFVHRYIQELFSNCVYAIL